MNKASGGNETSTPEAECIVEKGLCQNEWGLRSAYFFTAKPLRTSLSPLGEVENLYLVVFQPALLEVIFYEVDHFREDFVGVAALGGHAGHAYDGALPVIMVGDLSGCDVELVDHARKDGLEILSLILERVVLRQVEGDASCANNHLNAEW